MIVSNLFKKKVHNVIKTNFAEARNAGETHVYFNNPLRVEFK